MKHAFVLHLSSETPVAIKCCRLLRQHFCDNSRLSIYYDGKAPVSQELQELADSFLQAAHEPDEVVGRLNALNFLQSDCREKGIPIGSFLIPGMIPLFPEAWASFLKRFEESGKLWTFSPKTAKGPLPDLRHLHLAVPLLDKAGVFPIKKSGYPTEVEYNFPDYHISFSLPKKESYPLWNVGFDGDKGQIIYPLGAFAFETYCPESSMIRSRSEGFWENYEPIAAWDKEMPFFTRPIAP